MGIHYLVDYENVHESGLYGIDLLTAEDSVYIFHTSSTERITLSLLDNVRAWVKVIPVPPGKQSLDMHLGSFLGYLIGKEENPDTRYAIVSHDSDYKGIAGFWNRSFQECDTVQCIDSLRISLNFPREPAAPATVQDSAAERIGIREFILREFSRNGFVGLNGLPCMLVSELCDSLNSLPDYNNARRRTGKKPMQYLRDECRDILSIRRQGMQDWAYLQGEKEESLPAVRPSEEPTLPEETVLSEEEPDIMDMNDLSINDEPFPADFSADEAAAVQKTIPEMESVSADGQQEPEPADQSTGSAEQIPIENMELTARTAGSLIRAGYRTVEEFIQLSDKELLKTRNLGQKGVNEIRAWAEKHRKTDPAPAPESREKETGSTEETVKPQETDFLTIAAEFLQKTDETETNSRGDKRASALRDELLKHTAFRTAQKESGLKPIPYMQELFTGRIRFYREKGIFRAALCERKKTFYEEARANIQKRLSDAGLEKNAAEEIANIFMHSKTAVEPRKVIHNLLCQRFGSKIGAQYYKKAVKYAGM